ncbi:MAG TPA: magnesium and cobalt transport protein CorA, partial [Rhodocyclaceae bacterium]|nr:magnesium and cobalt transport protein CorA [Rhodocyclaceae bacterium]
MSKRPDGRPRKQRTTYVKKLGQPPGALQHMGEIKVDKPSITLFDYSAENLTEITFASLDESRQYKKHNQLIWLNVHGVHDVNVMATIGERFRLHS